ncbi:MAG: phosphotransferase [Acidimicrobiales bacterium]|nr:phosphotransferase [Acidimicrobiales bacterium]
MATFPAAIEDVTIDWVTDALHASGDLGADARVRAVHSEPIGVGVGLMGLLHRLSLDYDGAPGPATAIAKFPVPHAETRHVAKTFRFYEKEVGFYRDLAAGSSLGTPAVYAAQHDADSDDFALLLEDIADRGVVYSQTEGCPPDVALTAARALGRHAATFLESPAFEEPALAWLPFGHETPFPEGVIQGVGGSWEAFQQRFPELIDDRIRDLVPRYLDSIHTLMTPADGRPITLMHGDYRLDNLFFAGDDVTAIDWQICAKGTPAYDLGYFVSQSLTVEDRRAHEDAIIDAWFEGFEAAGGTDDRDAFMEDYRRVVMFCLCYPLQSGGALVVDDERARQLVVDLFNRCMAAIEDHDAAEFLG